MISIIISSDFSDTPGGRYINESTFSGEEFREKILLPKYEEAIEKHEKLLIDFDGCFGFGTSFLEEAFGGLVREHSIMGMLNHIEIKSTEDETIPNYVNKYIKAAEDIKKDSI